MRNNERDKMIVDNIISFVEKIAKEITDASNNGRLDHYEEITGTKHGVSAKKCTFLYKDKEGVQCSVNFERKYFFKDEEDEK